MDCRYPNLMAREDIIRILKERQLKIPNIDDLSHNELIKIFSKFALPLGRRADKAYNTIDCIPLTNIDKNKKYNGKINCLKRITLPNDKNSNNNMKKSENHDQELNSVKRCNSDKLELENTKNSRKKITYP